MQTGSVFVSELSTSRHVFSSYHFCRGNSNRRKTRIGIIRKGSGAYIYLNKKIECDRGRRGLCSGKYLLLFGVVG